MRQDELAQGKEAIDVVEETQDWQRKKSEEEIKVGDKVVHSTLYIGICRGKAKERAKTAEMEVIALTGRSVTTRPWGSQQKYGSQFDRRYIRKAES